MKALVLMGDVSPGQSSADVWPRVASLFKLDTAAFEAKVLARCPLSIREAEHEEEVSRLVAALTGCGAVAEVLDSDGTKWSIEREGRVCGPVPTSYLRQQNGSGTLPSSTRVKKFESSVWMNLKDALSSTDIVFDVPPDAVPTTHSPPSQQPIATPKQVASTSTAQSAMKEPAGKSLLKAVGWFALAAVIYGCGQYITGPGARTTSAFHGRVKLISLGLEFVSCEPDSSAYKCVVRAMQPMDVREQCAYFDSQGRIIGSPKNVSDLSGVNFAAHETRVVTVYAFDKEVTTIECNYVPETYKYDALMKGFPDLKKEGVAWEIDI